MNLKNGTAIGICLLTLLVAACATHKVYQISIPQVPLAVELNGKALEGRIHVESVRDRRVVGDERQIGTTTLGLFNAVTPVDLEQKPSEVVRQLLEGTLGRAGLLEPDLDDSRYVLAADLLQFDTQVIFRIKNETAVATVKYEVTVFNRATGEQVGQFEATGQADRTTIFDITASTGEVMTAALQQSQGAFAQQLTRVLSREAVFRKQQAPFTPLLVPSAE
jgi:hypothetical protein